MNLDQNRDCVGLIGKLVPLVIEIMINDPDTLLISRRESLALDQRLAAAIRREQSDKLR